MNFYPEGHLIGTRENIESVSCERELSLAMRTGRILEAETLLCDKEHNLHVYLPCMKGIIPRREGAIGIESGETRDIALISRVSKPVCFVVDDIVGTGNEKTAVLSRLKAQKLCLERYINELEPGDIIPARVSHLEQFGAFVDVGCGIPSLVPIDLISVSRISHPADRFYQGQSIRVIVKGKSGGKLWLSHKELLGTWNENASEFSVGETVMGIVRSIEEYGIFIELAPNLAGLAEAKPGITVGQSVSVYIKSIIGEKMKIKLIIVEAFGKKELPPKMKYYIETDKIKSWVYSTGESKKQIKTDFC